MDNIASGCKYKRLFSLNTVLLLVLLHTILDESHSSFESAE